MQALRRVRPGGTILLATAGRVVSYSGNFTVATPHTSARLPVTIKPAPRVRGPVLDGDGSDKVRCPMAACDGAVLTVRAGVVARIESITIRDGRNAISSAGGGGINDLGTVSLVGVDITDCIAYVGGAVAVGTGAHLTVENSSFTKDQATYFGGAIGNGTTIAGHAANGQLKVSRSTFSRDSAPRGGAISNGDGGVGELTVFNSTFTYDSAARRGGAIDNGDGGTGSASVAGSTFAYDNAPIGGAINNADSLGTGTLSVETSTFYRDRAAMRGAALSNGFGTGRGSALILNTTVADSSGRTAINVTSGTVQVAGSIIAASAEANCAGHVTDDGYNLEDDTAARCGFSKGQHDIVGKNPRLGPLASNGGPTQTMKPQPTSPVLYQIPYPALAYLEPSGKAIALCPVTDQRGDGKEYDHLGCSLGSVDTTGNVPVITSLGTTAGPAAGRAVVIIHGGNFGAGLTVRFGSAAARKVTVVSKTEITVVSPAFAGLDGSGTVAVTATSASGLSSPARITDLYTYYSADWSAYLNGSMHSSYNPGATSITPSHMANLQPIWQLQAPPAPNDGNVNDYASPIVSNGVVYVGLEDGDMYALSEMTGAVIWSHNLGIEEANTCTGPWGITSTATVANSPGPGTGTPTVYVNAPDGYLYALNAATGQTQWRSVVGIPPSGTDSYYAWGSPTVANGKVYIGIASNCDNPLVPGGVLEFSQRTGALLARWNSLPSGDLGGSVWSSIAVLPDGNIVATTGNSSDVTQQVPNAESVVVLDGSTLKLLDSWMIPMTLQITDSDFGGSPTVFTAYPGGVATTMVGACNKDGVYFAFRADDLHAGPLWEHRMGAPTGTMSNECDAAAIWNGHDLIEGGGSAITINGKAYAGSVQALDPTTGKVIWATGLPGWVVGSPAEDGGGVVAAPVYHSADDQAGIYLLSATTGRRLKFLSVQPRKAFAQPVFDGNDLLIGDISAIPVTAFAETTPGQDTPITVTSSAPLNPRTNVTLTVTGSGGFVAPATAIVSGASMEVRSVQIDSPTTATVKVAVFADAPPGVSFNLTIVEPKLTTYSCVSCLTVG